MNGTLTILASISLTEVFGTMAHNFSTTYPAVRVDVAFAPETEIGRRIAAGAVPDLVAVEGSGPLAALGSTSPPLHFARGQLVLAVRADNPKALHGLSDLNRPDVRLALCVQAEPCGAVAASVLDAAHISVPAGATTVSDVREALDHVTDGSADAALVYRSDARLAGDVVATLELPESSAAMADFVAVVPARAPNPQAANAFLAYLGSPDTLDGLTRAGFRPPD
jgi:molybdate transport system substrate-binding protein